MRHFLLLGFFLLATLLGQAQASGTAAPMQPLANAPAAETDTLTALHNLYKHKRRSLPRALLTTGGLVVISFFVYDILSPTRTSGRNVTIGEFIVPIYIGALGSAVVGGELLYYRQFNKRHERRSIEEFRAHQLRRSVREQLKPTYFQPTPPTRQLGG